MASKVAVGIMAHLVALTIGFLLFLIGVSSLTASLNGLDCNGPNGFARCKVAKGLEVISCVKLFLLLGLHPVANLARAGYYTTVGSRPVGFAKLHILIGRMSLMISFSSLSLPVHRPLFRLVPRVQSSWSRRHQQSHPCLAK